MIKFVLPVILLFFSIIAKGQETVQVSIIPEPVSVERLEGKFIITDQTAIEIRPGNNELERLAGYLSEKISGPAGFKLKIRKTDAFTPGNIHLQFSSKSTGNKEGYELTADPQKISIAADSAAGIFYGIQTLFQLLPGEIGSDKIKPGIEWAVPSVRITDYPRFGWRGAMFDVSRHFFTKDQVKQFIDDMVRYKFNLLHLHLTDDQGWRLQIKSLPRLTEVGAWRPERLSQWRNRSKPTPDEPKNYGGFYTHDDIRELIQYARDRFVSILPEIDVPGHSMAAVASYPELSCTEGTYAVNAGEQLMQWHSKGFSALKDNTLCPANEKVYTFLDKVITEVAELFPFEYIHMGGDECAKNFWEKSKQIKELMAAKGLKNMDEVQSYFVKRVEKIVKSKGKKMIGWDEILEGGIPEDATVMSWRGMKGGIQAAKEGHKVVMSPTTHAYVDLYQGDPVAEPPTYSMLRLRDSYQFNPLPEGIDEKLILGGQGNLWTEQIQNMRHAQYMLWPRGLALAESVWSPLKNKNWNRFIGKVENEFSRMDIARIKYARSMYDPIFRSRMESGKLVLIMETEIEGLDIHYSFDGSNPDNYYPKYSKPLVIPKDVTEVKVITYRNGVQTGKQINMPVAELTKRAKK